MKLRVVALLVAIVACHPSPPVSPTDPPRPVQDRPPVADPLPPPSRVEPAGDDLRAACANLARLSCPEGGKDREGLECPEHLARVRAERAPIPADCLAKASTVDVVRTCGEGLNVVRFRCVRP